MKKIIFMSLAGLSALCSVVQAGVPVVEESQNFIVLADNAHASVSDAELSQSTRRHDTPVSPSRRGAGSDRRLSLLLNKIEAMQQELEQLRGLQEVQQHTLTQIQKKQLSANKQPDKPLAAKPPSAVGNADEDNEGMVLSLKKAAPKKSPQNEPVASAASAAHSQSDTGDVAEQQLSYVAAYELIENKDFTRAKVAMQDFVRRYPRSAYTPNAHYWLGELLLKQHKNTLAINAFKTVLEQFPDSNKVAAAAYKLGVAYARNGDVDRAKQQLLAVQARFPDTSTARLASSQLRRLGSLS